MKKFPPSRPEFWINAACEAFCVDKEQLLEMSHGGGSNQICRYRQATMWVARAMTASSYPELAKAFRRKDHTTIHAGVNRAESDPAIIPLIEEIFEHVESNALS